MQHLKPKIAQSPSGQIAQKSEKKSGINEIICPESYSPIWQKAFALADNVRFTRTPDREMIRRRAAIDPVYAEILAEAEAAKAAYQHRREAEERALPPAEIAETEAVAAMAEAEPALPEAEPALPAGLAAGAAAATATALAPEVTEYAEENSAALPEYDFHEADAGRDCGPINQGYETIEQMRGFAVAAFGGAAAQTSAANVAAPAEAEQALAFALPIDSEQEIAASPAGDDGIEIKKAAKPVSCPDNIFPWNMKADKIWAAPVLAGFGTAASDEKEPQQAAPMAAAGFAPEIPPVSKQIDVIRLFKSMECRQPQMRWIPVPAHMAQTLAADSLSPANRPAMPAEADKTAENADILTGFAQQSGPFYPSVHTESGQNKNNAPGINFAAAMAQPPTLNLQFKLGGYNNTQDNFIWEHIQTAPAPLAPQNQENGARAANLDALCSLAVEQTGKAAAVPLPAAAEESIAAAPVCAQAEQREVKSSRAEPVEMPAGRITQPKTEARYSYKLPSLELLQEPVYHEENIISQESLERSAGLLENVLEDFGVRGEIIHVRPGPVVTLYEFEPAPGVKSSRVIGLSDDIARSMSAVAARVAVIPGRNVIGIELPNKKRETVYLREILQSGAYKTSDYKLPLALGKNIGGEPIIAELAKMPHLLVAGTTGSGKSVAINTMILSLIYRMSPQECRLIMVDPKMLELSVYDGIPHLLTPVVTDPKKALSALKWAVREMEDRYRKMAKLGVRNIDGFNARIKEALHKNETIMCTVQAGFDKETGELLYTEEAIELKPLPYIVVIIDEMADLMMVAGKEIEGAVQRLAQMARAAGIHVIMATQRPSVDVITGTIKANFPTRISFQVTSKIDSRTILGEQGAETLLGQGDMLHMAGGGRLKRVHGPFVSDREVEKVVAHLKTQGTPEYLSTVTESSEDEMSDGKNKAEGDDEHSAVAEIVAAAGGNDDFDDLYIQAVKIVMRDKKCSTSYIQRRLGIGYNKAATLVEKMEEEGLVGEANHVGKREILING